MIEELFMKSLVDRLNTNSNFVFKYENAFPDFDPPHQIIDEMGLMCYVFDNNRKRYERLVQIISTVDSGLIFFHHRDPIPLQDPDAFRKSLEAIECSVNKFARLYTKEVFKVSII